MEFRPQLNPKPKPAELQDLLVFVCVCVCVCVCVWVGGVCRALQCRGVLRFKPRPYKGLGFTHKLHGRSFLWFVFRIRSVWGLGLGVMVFAF